MPDQTQEHIAEALRVASRGKSLAARTAATAWPRTNLWGMLLVSYFNHPRRPSRRGDRMKHRQVLVCKQAQKYFGAPRPVSLVSSAANT
jgi:hypothetical protein